jgi:hypothetical protein
MSEPEASWSWTDAWLLTAICLAAVDGFAAVDAVVTVADHINHAVPTERELAESGERLRHAGLLHPAAGGFFCSRRQEDRREQALRETSGQWTCWPGG